MSDPLHDFARQRILASGGIRSPEEVEAARRDTARYNCRLAHRLALGTGIVFTAVGAITGAIAVASWLTADGTPSGAWLALVITSVVCLLGGPVLCWFSRFFAVRWELATKGSPARAIVIGVTSGGKVGSQRSVLPLLSTSVLRLAIQREGNQPYEARAVVVDKTHGTFVAGEEIAVLVDLAAPQRVFVRER